MFADDGHPSQPSARRRILLLEDDPTLLRLLTGYLEDAGHLVVPVDNAADALRIAAESSWDLIITDWVLKTTYASDFAAQLAGRNLKIPLLLITGLARPLESGSAFSQVLRKPFRRADFLETVSKLLGPEEPLPDSDRSATGS